MFRQIGAGEMLLILAVLLLFFGARKLPDLARSIGKSARELRKGLSGEDDDEDDDEEDAEDSDDHPAANGETARTHERWDDT